MAESKLEGQKVKLNLSNINTLKLSSYLSFLRPNAPLIYSEHSKMGRQSKYKNDFLLVPEFIFELIFDNLST